MPLKYFTLLRTTNKSLIYPGSITFTALKINMAVSCRRRLDKVYENLRFQNVFKFLRFEERFRDGLVWTVGLTGEIKPRFQIPPVHCGRGVSEGGASFLANCCAAP